MTVCKGFCGWKDLEGVGDNFGQKRTVADRSGQLRSVRGQFRTEADNSGRLSATKRASCGMERELSWVLRVLEHKGMWPLRGALLG